MAEEEEVAAVEYESDPEEANLLLNMRRRREASDDEEQDEEEEEEDIQRFDDDDDDSRVSDSQSEDAEGAAAEYHQQQDGDEEELEIEDEGGGDLEDDEVDETGCSEVKAVAVELLGAQVLGDDDDCDVDLQFGEDNAVGGGGDEERKKNEPFAVPTAGAFYMHDDRFRDTVAGARGGGGCAHRKLWESKDDSKWGHDEFEQMTIRQNHYEEGRRDSRIRNRGRGKIQGEQREHPRGNRTKAYNGNNQNNAPNNQIDVSNNQKNAIRGVRGRGPKKYQPVRKTYDEAPTHNKLLWKSVENNSHASSGRRVSAATSKTESHLVPARKHVLSSLKFASPPFYPSASSNKDASLTQKMDGQARPLQQELQSFVTDDTFPIPQSNTLRGKNVAQISGMNKLNIDEPFATHTEKPMTNLQLQASESSLINSSQTLQSRVQGRNQNPFGKMNYHSNAPHNEVNRVATPSQFNNAQRGPVHPPVQASGQQLGQRGGGIQALSPPNAAVAIYSFESKEMESLPELSKSRTTMTGKGRGSLQGSGKGTFPYGGDPITGSSGNMASSHDDQMFSTTPTFFPVMQFGGQHSGGVGIPAVGMAFPGYVGNPASGNSEMTWLPVLAGPAGALGAPYCSPYLSVDAKKTK